MTVKELFADIEKARAARAALVALKDAHVPFFVAQAQVARANGITTDEAGRRIEDWEELTGVKLERWDTKEVDAEMRPSEVEK
jgi:hypothetical protein